MSSNRSKSEGFTLVEVLVVIVIVAVLGGIAAAGLGYAMRRSRNLARQAAANNLDKAFAAYYADNQGYPAEAGVDTLADGDLKQYLEGSWDQGPTNSEYYYMVDTNVPPLLYAVCYNQERAGDNHYDYQCVGPGVGQTDFPDKDASNEDGDCVDCGGICRKWDGTKWGGC